LTVEDESGNKISFPDGTRAKFGGVSIQSTNINNTSIVIPIEDKSNFGQDIEIETPLENFKSGTYKLYAELYSSSVAGYYNSLDTGKTDSTTFTVSASPTYALKVEIDNPNSDGTDTATQDSGKLLAKGDTLKLKITTKSTNSGADTEQIAVNLYKYMGNDQYSLVQPYDDITITPYDSGETITPWSQTVPNESATYRLEFTYNDKVEYLDFIVK
jgi:hypothetical protein